MDSVLTRRGEEQFEDHNPNRVTAVIKCPAAWIMSQNPLYPGEPSDATGQMTFAFGHAVEALVVRLLAQSGHPLIGAEGKPLVGEPTDRQREVMVTVGIEPHTITVPGHLDGEYPDWGLVDVKSMSDYAFDRFKDYGSIGDSYLDQFNLYMRGTGYRKTLMIGIRKNRSNRHAQVIGYDEERLAAIDRRVAEALKVLANPSAADIRRLGWCVGKEELAGRGKNRGPTGRAEARERNADGMPATYCSYASVCPKVGAGGYRFVIEGDKPKWIKEG